MRLPPPSRYSAFRAMPALFWLAIAAAVLAWWLLSGADKALSQPGPQDLGHALVTRGFSATTWVNSFDPAQPYLSHGIFHPELPIAGATSYYPRYGMTGQYVKGSACGGELTPDLGGVFNGTCHATLVQAFGLPASYTFTETDWIDVQYVSRPNAQTTALCALVLPLCVAPQPTPSPTATPAPTATTPPPSCLSGECSPQCPANCPVPTPTPVTTPTPAPTASPPPVATPTTCPPTQSYVELPIPPEVLACALGFAGIHVTPPFSVVTWRAQRQACAQTINGWLHGLPKLYVPSSSASTGVTSQVIQ